jgi:hypothetical protein
MLLLHAAQIITHCHLLLFHRMQACHANIAPPWVFLGSLLQLLGSHPQMADSWTAAERLELHRACQLFLVHQAELAASGQQQGGVAVSAAMGLASRLANSVNVAGLPANGRASMTGSSLGGMGGGSGPPSGNLFGGQGRVPGSGPPSGSYGGLLGALAGAGGGISGSSPRQSQTSGGILGSGMGGGGDPLISTFGQLPATPQQQQAGMFGGMQQALSLQQQRARMQSATGTGSPSPAMVQLLLQQQQQLGAAAAAETANCPLCGSLLRQQDFAAHVEACLTANRTTAANFKTVLRQQHAQQQAQQQAQQEAAVHWVAQQQQAAQNQQLQNLIASQLLQQQQQQNLLAAAAVQASSGLLGLEELCKPAAGVDASSLAPWMMEAAAASRPPLRPMRRM